MTRQDYDILYCISRNNYKNQRDIASLSGYSLGSVNNSVKKLIANGYLLSDKKLTSKATRELSYKTPKNAIILAAECGIRTVPVNSQSPKGLMELNGERLIERLIKQLREKGIDKIYVVVGFMKEKYEYLIDRYGVELIVNNRYASENTHYSMFLASNVLDNSYIVPCEVWCAQNPFRENEFYSWYMLSDTPDHKSFLRTNRKKEIIPVPKIFGGNKMIGISYISDDVAPSLKKALRKASSNPAFEDFSWEEILFNIQKITVYAKKVNPLEYAKIDSYEQIQDLSNSTKQLQIGALQTIADVFKTRTEEIKNVKVLKKGMTNKSFLFTYNGAQYIMRIPGEGTDKLINRQHEAEVYKTISGHKLCDDPVYINPENGYKITRYIKNARVANPKNIVDVMLCVRKMKAFHEMKLKVSFDFDLFDNIDFYQSLWGGKPSLYEDYETTKNEVLSLREFVDKHAAEKVLTHIDAVPDNFLFDVPKLGELSLQLTDWEYAGMQDPHVDIAMFCIYSLYDKKHIDKFIDLYFNGKCTTVNKAKIYCYIAICGLLWSNWCEYKSRLGIEFGEYSLRQYRYAKDFYRYAVKEINNLENKNV